MAVRVSKNFTIEELTASTTAIRNGLSNKQPQKALIAITTLAQKVLQPVRESLGARELIGDDRIAKVSVVGVGMRSHAGVATRMFDALAEESINIQMISTSEIKISVVVAERYLELAVRAIHTAFDLNESEVTEE